MKKIEFEKKDGSKGTKYTLEAGDEVVSKYSSPRMSKLGQYENYSLGIEKQEEAEYVQLTKGQATKLEKEGDLQGKTIQAYKYTNDFGDQVGVKIKEETK